MKVQDLLGEFYPAVPCSFSIDDKFPFGELSLPSARKVPLQVPISLARKERGWEHNGIIVAINQWGRQKDLRGGGSDESTRSLRCDLRCSFAFRWGIGTGGWEGKRLPATRRGDLGRKFWDKVMSQRRGDS